MDRKMLAKLYYEEGKTLQEIGDMFGVTRERVRQVMEKYHLPRYARRRRLKWKSLDEYFDYVKKTGKESKPTLAKFLLPFKKQCEECGSTKNLHIHHIKYPATSLDDVQILCASCHLVKHKKGNGVKIQLEMCNRYTKGENGIELAKEYGITPGTVYRILKKWNIKRRPRFNKIKGGIEMGKKEERDKRLNDFRVKLVKYLIYIEGWRQADVARLLNLSRQRVNQIIQSEDKGT